MRHCDDETVYQIWSNSKFSLAIFWAKCLHFVHLFMLMQQHCALFYLWTIQFNSIQWAILTFCLFQPHTAYQMKWNQHSHTSLYMRLHSHQYTRTQIPDHSDELHFRCEYFFSFFSFFVRSIRRKKREKMTASFFIHWFFFSF